MVGITAPSGADTLLALAKFVQSPELQDKLKELQAAEEAANKAASNAADALKALADKEEKLKTLELKFISLPQREAAPVPEKGRLDSWGHGIKRAIAGQVMGIR